MRIPTRFAILMLALCSRSSTALEPRDARDTIQRGLQFLVDDGLAWKREHNCVSCHHAALPVWAMQEAKLHGYSVNESFLAEMTKWIAESGDGKTGVARPPAVPDALNTKAVWFALALNSDPHPDAVTRLGQHKMLLTIQGDQRQDGLWAAWPETRPPMFGDSNEIMTGQALLALVTAHREEASEFKPNVDKAWLWLTSTESKGNLQAIALRLIIAAKLEQPIERWQPIVRQMIERQNPDGGWSQSDELPSDAWGTGQALYALSHVKVRSIEPMVQRAIDFLSKTQNENGSWPMTSRPTRIGGDGSTSLIPITGAGAAWAILGLVRSSATE